MHALEIFDGKIIIFDNSDNLIYYINVINERDTSYVNKLRFFVTMEKLLLKGFYSQHLYPFLEIFDGKITIFDGSLKFIRRSKEQKTYFVFNLRKCWVTPCLTQMLAFHKKKFYPLPTNLAHLVSCTFNRNLLNFQAGQNKTFIANWAYYIIHNLYHFVIQNITNEQYNNNIIYKDEL